MNKFSRFIVVITAGIVLLHSPIGAEDFNSGSEPDGFGGLIWGTKIAGLKGMKLVRRDAGPGGEEIYTASHLSPLFCGVRVGRVEYGFWKGQLWKVSLLTAGRDSYLELREAVFKCFGAGELEAAPRPGITRFSWVGGITRMVLTYEDRTESGSLVITSRRIADDIIDRTMTAGEDD